MNFKCIVHATAIQDGMRARVRRIDLDLLGRDLSLVVSGTSNCPILLNALLEHRSLRNRIMKLRGVDRTPSQHIPAVRPWDLGERRFGEALDAGSGRFQGSLT